MDSIAGTVGVLLRVDGFEGLESRGFIPDCFFQRGWYYFLMQNKAEQDRTCYQSVKIGVSGPILQVSSGEILQEKERLLRNFSTILPAKPVLILIYGKKAC